MAPKHSMAKAVLSILRRSKKALTSLEIRERLERAGFDGTERTSLRCMLGSTLVNLKVRSLVVARKKDGQPAQYVATKKR